MGKGASFRGVGAASLLPIPATATLKVVFITATLRGRTETLRQLLANGSLAKIWQLLQFQFRLETATCNLRGRSVPRSPRTPPARMGRAQTDIRLRSGIFLHSCIDRLIWREMNEFSNVQHQHFSIDRSALGCSMLLHNQPLCSLPSRQIWRAGQFRGSGTSSSSGIGQPDIEGHPELS